MRRGGEVIAVGRRQWRSTETHRPDQWKAHARHVGQFAAVGPACELDRWGTDRRQSSSAIGRGSMPTPAHHEASSP